METWNILDPQVITTYILAKMAAQKIILHIEPSYITSYNYAAAGTVDFLAAIIWYLNKRSRCYHLAKVTSLPHAISFAVMEPERVLNMLAEDTELTIGLQRISALWQRGKNELFMAQVAGYQRTIARMKSAEIFWIFGGKAFPYISPAVSPQEALTYLLYRYGRLEKSYPNVQFLDNQGLKESMERRPKMIDLQISILMDSDRTTLEIV